LPYFIVRPIVWVLLHIVYAIYGGICFEGRDNVPRKGGALVTPNHISDVDPTAVGLALPRSCYVMAKEEIFSMGFLGVLSRWLHGFPVKRYTADRTALRYAEALLKRGEVVVMFPEGKLSEDGTLQPLYPGALLIAERAGVPIIPTIIEGTNSLLPYGETRLRRTDNGVKVSFGKPVTVSELTGGGNGGGALKAGARRLHALLLAMQQRRTEGDS
jgi:1-acyl-sn-glycerol-3-phosphate acyltransferase